MCLRERRTSTTQLQAISWRSRDLANTLNHDEKQINEILADPGSQFGPPPEHLRNPGRMNAAGILLLYLAFEEGTAVAEVRPTIGSDVVVGVLRPIKPMRLLDLSRIRIKTLGSCFRVDFP